MLWPWTPSLAALRGRGGFRRATGWFCGCCWGARPQGATWEKGAMCKWKEEVLDLHGCGQDSAQQCQLFQEDKCCPKKVAGGLGWSPSGCSRALGGSGMDKLPCHPTWAGLVALCLEQPAPARGAVSPDLFAFSLQDVSGRAGAVCYPCLENFPASPHPW